MLSVGIDNIGDMAVFACKGNIVSSDEGATLRRAVTSQANAKILVLDLTQVDDIEGDGLEVLSDLQHWALNQGIRLKLFGPSSWVKSRLEHHESAQFEIARFKEMIDLLAYADSCRAKAA